MARAFIIVAILTVFLKWATITYALPAFPGAEGFGSQTTGGRGGRIIFVTNTNDSGAGSLREALTANGKRIIIVKTGGVISLRSDVNVRNGDFTLFAQTAPGDGLIIQNYPITLFAPNFIIRGLRIRVGDGSGKSPDNRDSLQILGPDINNAIIDHSSFSWAIDEVIATWYPLQNLTFSWNIVSEALYRAGHSADEPIHSMGLLVGDDSTDISIHHNLFVHNNERNPLIKGGTRTEVINNVIYNWGNAGTRVNDAEGAGVSNTNIINNYYKRGPNIVTSRDPRGITIDSNTTTGSKVYISGNSLEGNAPATIEEQWALFLTPTNRYRSNSPAFTGSGITAQPANDIFTKVVDTAGASRPKRDSIDTRLAAEVKNKTGRFIDSPSQVGGLPNYAPGTYPTDSDNDGIPNTWETANNLSPNSAADATQLSPQGYMWIEEYANSLIDTTSDPQPTVTPTPPNFKQNLTQWFQTNSSSDQLFNIIDWLQFM